KIIPGPLKNNPTSVNLMRSLNQPKENIAFLRNVEELLYKIKQLYNEGKIDEALLIAKKYIQISVDSVQKKIFKELFFNALDFIRCTNSSFNNDLVLKNIKNVVDILHDFKLINSELCSMVICECLNCPSTLSSGLQMFSFCQKYKVSISCKVIYPKIQLTSLPKIGVHFMLEASEKELFEQAFQILEVFNQNNMKYIKLQEPLYDMHYVKTGIECNTTENLAFSFTVGFTALNACINLKKPKEAYLIFKSVSLNLPNRFDSKLKLEVRSREVLEHLLTLAEQGFSVEELHEYAAGLQDIYNLYMISFLNEDKDDFLKQLCSHLYGPNKELLVLESQVLRGLLIYFIRKKMIVEADKIFIMGYLQEIYGLGKFFKKLTTFVKEKPEKEDVDHLFSIGIQVKSGDITAPIVNYLKLNKYEGIKKRITTVLKELDPNAQFSNCKGRNFRLKSEWAYDFWFQHLKFEAFNLTNYF
ncbi:uncharacterized protein CEXT_562201, partial [Caerostris extrusa]